MVKERHEVSDRHRTAFYAVCYPAMREAALDNGYAMCLHGSMANDMDILCVPWVEEPSSVEDLVVAIRKAMGPSVWEEHDLRDSDAKPHNRVAYTLSFFASFTVDLSIMRPLGETRDRSLLKLVLDSNASPEVMEEVRQHVGEYSRTYQNLTKDHAEMRRALSALADAVRNGSRESIIYAYKHAQKALANASEDYSWTDRFNLGTDWPEDAPAWTVIFTDGSGKYPTYVRSFFSDADYDKAEAMYDGLEKAGRAPTLRRFHRVDLPYLDKTNIK